MWSGAVNCLTGEDPGGFHARHPCFLWSGVSERALRPPETTKTGKNLAPDWRVVYSRRLRVSDVLVQGVVVFGVQLLWLATGQNEVSVRGVLSESVLSYSVVSGILVITWMIMLGVFGTRGYRVLGSGWEEYRLVTSASLRLFGIVAILAYLLQIDIARGYLLISLPVGVAGLLASRWIGRQWLRAQRRRGRFSSTVLLVGSVPSATHLALQLARQYDAGYRVVGACLPGARALGTLPGLDVPVLGDFDSLMVSLAVSGADTVIITGSDELPAERVRELSWALEPGRQHLVMAPNLTDIGGPRIHTRPVAGLPLIHVEMPTFNGGKHFSKRVFDVVGSSLLLICLSPLLLLVAVAVRVTSPGSVFDRQHRVGLNGRSFGMLTFRSMIVNADDQLTALLTEQGTDDRPLFTVVNDPRLTPVGAFLRKFSLDEFPQLLNVLSGDMSLVGPRPQRDGEVALYDAAAHRRLYVKPGMSGLWQVNGRSNLSWDDSIRLDLYYVENWSLIGDILILLRTLRAVAAPQGGAN